MNKNLQTFFSTGEFAKLCNTTKDTLFHYDRVGILKPEVVRENGYRYYSANQFFDYDLIAVLKETGSSLHEIKRYLEHVDVDHFLALLTEKQTALAEEKARIERMELALRIPCLSPMKR